MKYLIFSDLHGSFQAIQKIQSIIEQNEFDLIISLGDILYHGPRNDLPEDYCPKKVIEFLKRYQNKMLYIKGNCDAEVDEMVLESKFYKMKKIKFATKTIYLTHGHHLSRFAPNKNLEKDSIVLYGHYHVFDISKIDDVIYINIGSTSIPKDGIPQYAIIDEHGIFIYSLEDYHLIGKYSFEGD